MTFQYSLRFESGERRGEVVPLTVVAAQGGTFTIGRKPGNSLQVTDASISGRHAELAIDEEGVSLRDLNSTNGTLAGGRKVRRAYLEPGDDFTLGAVEFTLIEFSEARPPAGGGASSDSGSDSLSDELDEIVLEDPDDAVAPGAAMPRKAPAPPAGKPPTQAAPAPATRPAPAEPAPAAARPEAIGETQLVPQEDGLEITAEDLARSAKSSKLGPILLVGLAAVGGGAWWWLGQKTDDEGGARQAALQPPASPAGNLLHAGYSFEEAVGWTSDADAAAEFSPARSARRSGARGIQADLLGAESALMESDSVRMPSGERAIRAMGYVRADEGVELRLGLRYSSGTGDDAIAVIHWSDPAPASDEFQELAMIGSPPQGLPLVQVLLRAECTDAPAVISDAEAEGDEDAVGDVKSVSVDDVELVAGGEAPAPISLDPVAVTPLLGGTSSTVKAVSLTSLNSVHISSIRVAQPTSDAGTGLGSQDLTMAAAEGGVSLTPAAGGTLVVRAESMVVEGGIATMSGGGYASHGSTFERDGVTGLILGDAARMIYVAFPEPTQLIARESGTGTVFRAEVPGGGAITVKTNFREERILAQRLARRAKEERSRGDSGAALATWDELLTTVPFDRSLINEAAGAQSELLAEGRAELKTLTEEVERARYFGLADLYREKLVLAADLGRRYRGTDVEAQAVALKDAIDLELSALNSSDGRDELQRLEAIGSVLRRTGAGDLAKRLDAYRAAQAGTQSGSDATSNPSGGQ